MDINEITAAVVDALEDIKGQDIVVLDTSQLTAMFERMVIASADSTRQTKALAHNVQEKLKEKGIPDQGIEGMESGEWVLLDLGSVVVHVMQPAVRQYYNLEELWSAAQDQRNKRNAAG
ncbi:ribosomal silencing factor RsfA [Sulfuriferula multivorans]|uniref:Ribosomal silencing factor RsfS n=1 Tax=Sulfuriferula multivorans TaxID=1559896 RepID=A0A401JCU9_9PROT|nr:ribosome silencing factor [Sulfuriferula multivorans]GBL45380.1 ribosomal silencing factor RsfA [Sulfuriferula multivorans]